MGKLDYISSARLRFLFSIFIASYSDALPLSSMGGSVNLHEDSSCATLYDSPGHLDINYCLGIDVDTVFGASTA